MLTRGLAALVCILSVGCSVGSKVPAQLRDVPRTEWREYASRLPLEDRLDLHAELYRVDQHPRDLSLATTFHSDAAGAFESIEQRIRGRRDFYTYIWIIISLEASSSLDVCSAPYKPRVVAMMRVADLGTEDVEALGLSRCLSTAADAVSITSARHGNVR